MDYKILIKMSGYLDALSTINSYFGAGHGHKYMISEFEDDLPLEQIVVQYNKCSNLKNHDDIKFLPLRALPDWKGSLFEVSAYWFFSLYRIQNFQVHVSYYDDNGKALPEQPAEFDKKSNSVSNKLIDLLSQFFDGKELIVYRLKSEVEAKNELDWEQFYFVTEGKVFILAFYQWG
ncbi:hypothetical protein [Cohnella sp. GCM10012308]|uniref:hypothetical protein n=1 Tax=Cohnella sp. GCM10012308 TaxID=3317329 RepID=UPI00361FF57C